MLEKTIQLNPDFLSITSESKRSKKTKKKKPLVKPNAVKNKLLERIKKFQHQKHNAGSKERDISQVSVDVSNEGFDKAFNESIEFLDRLSNKKTTSLAVPSPPYGSLKNGNKPTYRTWKKTQKLRNNESNIGNYDTTGNESQMVDSFETGGLIENNSKPPKQGENEIKSSQVMQPVESEGIVKNIEDNIQSKNDVSKIFEQNNTSPLPHIETETIGDNNDNTKKEMIETKIKAEPILNKDNKQEKSANVSNLPVMLNDNSFLEPSSKKYDSGIKPQKRSIVSRKKYRIGKNGNKISILIKDSKTRKRIDKERSILKSKTISEVKNHLKKQNFMKAGSLAPSDVLKVMYEQSILAGEIKNTSKETLIHNFISN